MSLCEMQELKQMISRLEAKLEDQEKSLPAHSIRPHQLMEIEDLEEQISKLKVKLAEIAED